ncbi:MAG TPA: stage II sporulation protein M [Methanoregulaceae archaeon]|nr:stage II sporulation protein M [Methanoregulaceae archaeon]
MSEKGVLKSIIIASVIFFACLVLGILLTMKDPSIGQNVLTLFKDSVMEGITGDPPIVLCAKIFLNNLQACLLLFLGGASFGVVSLFILSTNGLIIGSIIEVVREKQGIYLILAAIVPHGIFEIPSFILSGALGFLLAKVLLDEWNGKGDAASSAAQYGRFFVVCILPLILLAAVVEAFITPQIINLVH